MISNNKISLKILIDQVFDFDETPRLVYSIFTRVEIEGKLLFESSLVLMRILVFAIAPTVTPAAASTVTIKLIYK